MTGILESLKKQGFDTSQINLNEMRDDGVLSSTERTIGSYKFKDKNGTSFGISMSFKSDEKGVGIGEYSDEMKKMKEWFDEGKKKFGDYVETKVEVSGSVS